MYCLELITDTVVINRLSHSKSIMLKTDKTIEQKTIPIIVDNIVISEAKVIGNYLKVITNNTNCELHRFNVVERQINNLIDKRPINYKMLEFLIPDLFSRYPKIVNLELNVRFK